MFVHVHTVCISLFLHNLQIKHVSTQTEKMIEIALASVKAAEREEAIGCTSDSSMLTQDPQVQVHVLIMDKVFNMNGNWAGYRKEGK